MIYWNNNNGIGYLTMDNMKGNMLDVTDLEKIDYIILHELQRCNGLIISGRNRAFCTGLNITDGTAAESFKLLDKILFNLYTLDIPVAIALTGHAIGAGFLMLCCADYIVASDNLKVKYGLPELRIGLGLDQFMISLLSTQFTNSELKKLIFNSEYVNSLTLYEWGIISDLNNEDMIDLCKCFIGKIKYLNSFSLCKRNLNKENIEKLRSILEDNPYVELLKLVNK